MKFSIFLFFILNCYCSDGFAFNNTIKNFSQAKRLLPLIHNMHPFTLYCNCKYEANTVDLKSCDYQVHKNKKRATRLEWEHVVPAEAFGHSFIEWRVGTDNCVTKKEKYKGRRCAGTNSEFAKMESDLYNLFPEVGELNGLRRNYSMAALGTTRGPSSVTFGGCKAVIEDRKFEPMDHAKGIVARTYMYMDQAYPGRGIISEKNTKLFEAWDKLHPVSVLECKRAEMIKAIQGNENEVLKKVCSK